MFSPEQLAKKTDDELNRLKDPYNSDPQIASLAKDEINRRKLLKQNEFSHQIAEEQNKTVMLSAKLLGKYTIVAAILGIIIGALSTYIIQNLPRLLSNLPQTFLTKTNSVSLLDPPNN
jgi:DNA replication protein DnaC